MSRVSYSEEEDYPGQFALWQANCDRSLRGKAGRAALLELEAALVALPRKRLVSHVVACDGDVCAVGAVLLMRKAHEVGGVDEAQRQLEAELGDRDDQAYDDTAKRWEALGVPRLVAWKIVALNDVEIDGRWCYVQGPSRRPEDYRYFDRDVDYRGVWQYFKTSPEERYEKVLAWVREQLASQESKP